MKLCVCVLCSIKQDSNAKSGELNTIKTLFSLTVTKPPGNKVSLVTRCMLNKTSGKLMQILLDIWHVLLADVSSDYKLDELY